MPVPIKATISGSSSATVLGLNKYQSAFQFWLKTMEDLQHGFCEENNHEFERFEGNASTRFGHAFESANIAITENKLGYKITDQEKVFKKEYNGVPLSSHVDGIINIDGKDVLFEGKTTTERAFQSGWDINTNGIPKNYLLQLMHNMYLSDTDEAIISVLVFPFVPADMEKMGFVVGIEPCGEYCIYDENKNIIRPIIWADSLSSMGYHHIFRIQRDDELINDEILPRYEQFWNDHVLTKTAPPINGYDDIKWLIASPEGEIEATPEMKSLWSEKCDIENEVKSLLDRKDEIKDSFAKHIQIEIESKNVKPGHEDRKLNIFAGALKLGSITKAYPGLKTSKKMVATAKEDDPELYEMMKKTTFLEIMSDSLEMTDKQKDKLKVIDKIFADIAEKLETGVDITEEDTKSLTFAKTGQAKFLKSMKLSKLLTKDSTMKALQKHKPDIYNFFHEHGLVEETTPKAVLRLSKSSED